MPPIAFDWIGKRGQGAGDVRSGFHLRIPHATLHASRVEETMEKLSVQNFFVKKRDLSKALIVRQSSAAFRSLRGAQETRSTPNRSRLADCRRSYRTAL